ncbi:MAG: helix-turn-helix transcriptional regulator [Clostridia bacterium]|nr:helix-turn-helix transcriptional regulator [Clostridia bacterium]
MSIKFRFAGEIYHSRQALHITQEEAAEILGVSVRWYQQIESGHVLPSALLTLKIIAFFEIEGKKLKAPENVFVSHN